MIGHVIKTGEPAGELKMKSIKLYEVLGLAVILGLTIFSGVSCAKANSQELSGVTWVLKSYGDPQNPGLTITGHEPTLMFDKEKKNVNGNGGVNGYGGDYTIKGNNLTISGVIHTLIASTDESLNRLENAFFNILGSAQSYKTDGKQLTITGTQGILVFEQR
jgi:heat shock protein HslJ